MSISLYFGLPGCGKTTMLASIALKESRRRPRRYQHIYSNVPLKIDGVTFIDNDCLGKYDISDALVLIDEATLFANNRNWKQFGNERTEYFLLHRHFNVDIIFFAQEWASLDKRIRSITDRVYYVYKGFWTRSFLTCCYRIPYGIIIPDPKKAEGGEKLGEIIQGYCKPNIIVRLFSPKLFRPLYYKYFDSWERPYRDPLPDEYTEYRSERCTVRTRIEGSARALCERLKVRKQKK